MSLTRVLVLSGAMLVAVACSSSSTGGGSTEGTSSSSGAGASSGGSSSGSSEGGAASSSSSSSGASGGTSGSPATGSPPFCLASKDGTCDCTTDANLVAGYPTVPTCGPTGPGQVCCGDATYPGQGTCSCDAVECRQDGISCICDTKGSVFLTGTVVASCTAAAKTVCCSAMNGVPCGCGKISCGTGEQQVATCSSANYCAGKKLKAVAVCK